MSAPVCCNRGSSALNAAFSQKLSLIEYTRTTNTKENRSACRNYILIVSH